MVLRLQSAPLPLSGRYALANQPRTMSRYQTNVSTIDWFKRYRVDLLTNGSLPRGRALKAPMTLLAAMAMVAYSGIESTLT